MSDASLGDGQSPLRGMGYRVHRGLPAPCLRPPEAEAVPFPEGEPLGGVTCRRNPRGIGGGAKSLSSSPESFRPS